MINRSLSRFLECLIVLGLAVYLVNKWITGKLSFYINHRFYPLTLLGAVILTGMAVIGLWRYFVPDSVTNVAQQNPGYPKQKSIGIILLIIIPVLIVLLGLSMPVIVSSLFLILVIGVSRLVVSQASEQKPSEISSISLSSILILTIPLILGVFVPANPLTASSVNNRGMSVSAPLSLGNSSNKTLGVAPDDRTVLDWIKVFNYEKDVSRYLGQQANVIGFVYHDERLNNKQFMVSRFAITCCVADAFAIGMVVNWDGSAQLTDNTWVDVQGTIDQIDINGETAPIIHAQSVTPVDAPEQPYVYP
jgi:putative membrane protein